MRGVVELPVHRSFRTDRQMKNGSRTLYKSLMSRSPHLSRCHMWPVVQLFRVGLLQKKLRLVSFNFHLLRKFPGFCSHFFLTPRLSCFVINFGELWPISSLFSKMFANIAFLSF